MRGLAPSAGVLWSSISALGTWLHLFAWLAAECGHPHPYTDALVRYAPVKVRPSTLAADFIRDLLAVTGTGGCGRSRTPETTR
jgi:hypothetical protein